MSGGTKELLSNTWYWYHALIRVQVYTIHAVSYHTVQYLYQCQWYYWITKVIFGIARYLSHNKYNLALTSQVPELTTSLSEPWSTSRFWPTGCQLGLHEARRESNCMPNTWYLYFCFIAAEWTECMFLRGDESNHPLTNEVQSLGIKHQEGALALIYVVGTDPSRFLDQDTVLCI